MRLLSAGDVVKTLAHYGVTSHLLVKEIQIGNIKPHMRLGQGNAARNYFTVADLSRIAFYRILVRTLGHPRVDAAVWCGDKYDQARSEGRLFFKHQQVIPIGAPLTPGCAACGFDSKPPRHGVVSPFTAYIDLDALDKEIRVIMNRLGIGVDEHGE